MIKGSGSGGPGGHGKSFATREQLGIAKELSSTEYDRLLLSLQSPLPNEQDMAITVCTLLSNETKHALKFDKSPAMMEMLLAHAGIFNHCSTRNLMEETYEKCRGLSFHDFWRNTLPNSDVRELLCECSLERYQNCIGIVPELRDESFDDTEIQKPGELDSLEDEELKSEIPLGLIESESTTRQRSSSNSTSEEESRDREESSQNSKEEPDSILDVTDLDNEGSIILKNEDEEKETGADTEEEELDFGQSAPVHLNPDFSDDDDEDDVFGGEEILPPGAEKDVLWDLLDKDVMASNVDCESCCPRCPCLRQPAIFDSEVVEQENDVLALEKYAKLTEKIGQRIHQVSSIIRNLSFDKSNAEVMGHNTCILRFILVTANCSFGTLSQQSFDTLGNIARYMILEDPMENPYYSMVLSLVTDGIFSTDRFRILRSLEILRDWCREECNEGVISRLLDSKFFKRLVELLTLTDIMLLIYTLECILSITSTGLENMCDELALVPGSVDTLVSLVTVEAQSYGPKGCIHMRVVETLIGPQAIRAVQQAQAQAAIAQLQSQETQSVPTPPIPITSQPPPLTRAIPVITTKPPPLVSTPVSSLTPNAIRVERQSTPVTIPAPDSPRLPRLSKPSVHIVTSHNGIHTPKPQSSPTIIAQQPEPQIYNPSIINVPNFGQGITEEAWAVLWMKAAFEQIPGCSIEQGKIYRMYCTARKDSSGVLSMEDFIKSVKCTYGSGIGPVIKNFSGTPLSFLEGLRPKITLASNVGLTTSALPQSINLTTEPIHAKIESSDQPSNSSSIEHIPSTENKILSPILKATLSRPPKTPKNSNKSKGRKNRDENRSSILNPTSSAIRSLLATKVTQRQQKKLQQSETRKVKDKKGIGKKKNGNKNKVRVNGIDSSVKTELPEVSSPSNSLQSTESTDSVNQPMISFQGILRNGLNSEPLKKEVEGNGDISSQNPKFKGMLVDLLERKVNPRETVNGLVGNREIRISDRGLELIESNEAESNTSCSNNSNSTHSSLSTPNHISESPPVPESQQMTFYSASDGEAVKNSERKENCFDSKVLMSGGGGVGGGGNSSSDGDGVGYGTGAGNNMEMSMDDAELLEKFNEISDLIVVPPEQFGLKRGRSTSSAEENLTNHNEEPPTKKSNIDSPMPKKIRVCPIYKGFPILPLAGLTNEDLKKLGLDIDDGFEVLNSQYEFESIPKNLTQQPETSKAIITYYFNLTKRDIDWELACAAARAAGKPLPEKPPPIPYPTSEEFENTNTNHVQQEEVEDVKPAVAEDVVKQENGISGTIAAPTHKAIVPVPIRLAVPGKTPLAFARPLVLSGGQQILLQTPTAGGSLHGAKVYLSRPANSNSGETRHQYFLVQSTTASTSSTQPLKISTLSGISLPLTTSATASFPVISATATANVVPTTVVAASRNQAVPAVSPSAQTKKSSEQLDLEIPYLCEWIGCGIRFLKPEQLLMHALQSHVPESLTEAIRCEWHTAGCDTLLRKRFSLMTHLQDRHCSKAALEVALYRRKSKIEPPPPPQPQLNHLGYAPNAAFHAIKRHALQFSNPKELMDDNEGPVTKSIRLTAALILKNLCNYSHTGRRSLKGQESRLASIAMSNVESSRTISQLLFDMNELGS